MLVIPGQTDDVILGSNAIKRLLQLMKGTDRIMSEPSNATDQDCRRFLSLLSNSKRWRGESVADKVGTVKLKQCVTLQPQCEHLVWCKLPESAVISVGSTVIVEPSPSRSKPKNVMVGRVITPLWGDMWVPLKFINPTNETVVLKRNTKVADVFPCIAVEDLSPSDGIQVNTQHVTCDPTALRSSEEMESAKLGEAGIA